MIGISPQIHLEDFNVAVYTTREEASAEEEILKKLHGNSEFYHTQIVERLVVLEEVEELMNNIEEKNKEIEEKLVEKLKRLEQKEYYMRRLLKELL